jgi:heme-degrading monooxygenase HmoA
MDTTSRDQSVFRFDRFVVPAASETEFLRVVTEIDAFLAAMHGCLRHHILKQDGVSGEYDYITIVEWISFAAIQKAREAMILKHKAMDLDPQEMFARLETKAELGNYVPVLSKEPVRSTDSMSSGRIQ